jgi:exopolysaccharide biosynthesis protein
MKFGKGKKKNLENVDSANVLESVDKVKKVKVKKEKSEKKKWSTKKKVVVSLSSLFVLGVSCFLFLFYGPWAGFRNFWITSAMTTMSHQYLATWFYTDETIQKVLANNSVIEVDEVSNSDAIQFKKYTTTIYRNEYDKDVLTKDPGNDLYKVIKIREAKYEGFLVVVYDPSRIQIATTAYLGKRGEDILTVSQREGAVIAMNAGGFFDPDWNSNGALPHGTVFSKGQVVSDYIDANMGGGFIGFTNEHKLILGRMTKQDAINTGYRDAIEFGPYLIVNGKRSFYKGNGGWGIAPRSAIGQRKDGIVLMLVVNGRLAHSIGADMIDLTDIMERYGAYNAANLDGGSSSELVINGQIINTPVAGGRYGLRDMSTFWIVK